MTEERFYQDLLALPGLNVTAVEVSQKRITVEGHLEVKASACPVCGEPMAILNRYDTRQV